MTCSYAFTDTNGKPALITGKESFKAYLVSGGLANFGINLQSDKGEAKFSRSGGSLPDTITVNGVERPTTNSKGQPIHPTEEGVRKFWDWFSGSKVVDEQGRPLAVYHGTRRSFDFFVPSKPRGAFGNPVGIYFDTDRQAAEEYAMDVDGATDEKSRIIEAYVRIANDGDGVIKTRTERGLKQLEIIAFHPEQIKSATNNAGTFDPANPDIRLSFAGQSSRTADKHALSSAQSRLDAGESAERVRQDTGWFKGNDGKWRYEISDADAKLRTKKGRYVDIDVKENSAGVWGEIRLGDLLDHPSLFSAYPQLQNMSITLKSYGGNGGFFRDDHIVLNGAISPRPVALANDGPFPISKEDADRINAEESKLGNYRITHEASTLSLLLHEIQHGIQHKEGFATGGSPESMASDIEALSELNKLSFDEMDSFQKVMYGDLRKRYGRAKTARAAYLNLAGEVEARNTQTRQSMTDAERRATPPSETADVADSDVIVMFNGKEMASAPKPDNAKGSRGRTREIIHPEDFAATMRAAKRIYPGVQIIGHDSDQANSVPRELKASIKRQGATNDVKGAFHNGEIHIFGSAIPDIHTLEFTIAHEGTHFGLSSKFGPGIDEVMLDINRNNPTVAARAEELQAQYGYSVARSTEEALADLGGDMVKVKGFARLVAYIRDFLRKHGFVTEWSDNDIAALVMAARDYAKNKNATTVYRGSVFSQNLTNGRKVGNVPGMDDAENVAGKQAPNPAGDVKQGGAKPRYTPRNWKEWSELPQFQSDDTSTVLFNHGHGGYIKQVEARTSGVFDGLFALNAPGMTERGPDVTAFRIPDDKMLHQRDLDYEMDSETVSAALIDVFPRKIEAGSERFDSAWSAIVEDKSDHESLGVEDDGSIREDSFMDILGYSAEDAGEASWMAQKLRGRLAEKLGYQAVQMDDENGSSWYIVPGVKSITLPNEQSTSARPDIAYSRTSLISPAQRALTRTDAFKEWFGSSKMTAQDGTPLLFMHGTPAKFDAFDSKHVGANSSHTSAGLGHFFTREVATAQKYADGGAILKGWIKMERPYVMPLKEAQAFESAKDSAARRMELQQKGYDGAVILDDQGKPWATVAFHPWQFKSTENKGAFDEFDDRFRFSRTNQGQAGAWPIEPIGKGDRFIYNMQNKQIDTKRVVEAAKKSGVNVTDDINPALQEKLYHGRSAKQFEDFRGDELRPLVDAIRSAGLSITDVETFVWAEHAPERNAQIAKVNDKMPDGGSGLTNKQAADLLAGRDVTVDGHIIKGINPADIAKMQPIARMIYAITKKTRQMLVDSGMETQETIDAMEAAYSKYVTLNREDIEQAGLGTGMGFSVRGSASKRATGSSKKVVDILGNIANQRERQIARIEKNRVGQAVLGLAKAAPNDDFWKVDDVPMLKAVEATPVFTAYDKAGKVLGTYSTQLQADRAHPSAGVTIRRTIEDKVKERIDPTFRSKDEVFHVRVDGKDHFVIFNARDERSMRMAMALKNLDADQLGAVLQVTSKATRFFAAMATQFNPIWGVVNLTRDVPAAMMNLSTTPIHGKQKEVLKHTMSALMGIYQDARDRRAGKKPTSQWAAIYEDMKEQGGQTGYKDMYANAKDRTEALERELDPTKWMQSPLGKIFTANGRLKVPMEIAQKRAEGFFGWLSDFNEMMENAIRLAAYKTAIDSGISKPQAAEIAKESTVNFNTKGQVATQAGALYAFFNAAMQGSARLAETLRGPLGKKIIKGGLALGVMQAMMLSAAGMGDDEPPEFVRERSFIIPIGDGKYFSIPLPLGFHILPNLSRIPTEYAMSGFKNGGKRIADLFGLVADTFNPIGNAGLSLQTIAPTVIDPLAALAENKDYTGKRIAKEDMSSLHPTPGYLRAKDTASEISKFMAQLFNAASGGTEFKQGMFSPTPDQLDYLIGQIAGGVGREALKIDQTISSTVTGEELPMHKIPLLGRFVGDTKGQSAESGKFYAALTRINEHQAELKGLRASGRSAEAAEYAKENPEARLVLMATATERALSEDRKLKRKAIAAGNSELVKQIEARSSARMQAFNERLAALEN